MAARRFVLFLLATIVAGSAPSCTRGQDPTTTTRQPGTRRAQTFVAKETIYDGALGKGWYDYGWSAHDVGAGPAHVTMQSYGGWIVAHPALSGTFGALVFRMQAPRAWGDFLEVRLASPRKDAFPRVVVRPEHVTDLGGEWSEIAIPMRVLDPERLPFDRIVLYANRSVGPGVATIDDVVLTTPTKEDEAPIDLGPAREVILGIDCASKGTPISPLVYGVAYDPRLDATDRQQWHVGAAARRWGGNAASRFNWEIGNAWSTGMDWFWENVNYTGDPTFHWSRFLDDDRARHVATALTVPMLGWVAKDTTSYAFPVKERGAQQAFDGFKPDAGNGNGPDGKPLSSPPPTKTSVASTPESIGNWVKAIRARDDAAGARSVDVWILDNEPMLWNSTHRDVHPEPVGYDELLQKTIAYAEAVRAADPEGKIAGPALWGWPAYFFSAKDAAAGFQLAPDRAAHDGVPLLPWWLREVRAHEIATGHRLIDLVDVHFYPQEDRVGGADGGTDGETASLRVRATRSLWDPSYVDESWIAAPIELVPRLKQWIAENAPGVGIQIGEWNFGAETHASGGVAVAEALGRFGQLGVASAFYWTYPPEGSAAFWAFRAYRDFDGKGGRFLDASLPTIGDAGASIFASRDESGGHVVAVVLNLRGDRAMRPKIALSGAAAPKSVRMFRFAGEPGGFVERDAGVTDGVLTCEPLPPYSIAVFDLQLGGAS